MFQMNLEDMNHIHKDGRRVSASSCPPFRYLFRVKEITMKSLTVAIRELFMLNVQESWEEAKM